MGSIKTFLNTICVFVLLLTSSIGCTRKIYVPIETTSVDSTHVYVEKYDRQFQSWLQKLKQSVNVRDSVIIRDSVVTVINEVGDVVSREAFHNVDRSHSRDESVEKIEAKYDSIFKAQREEISAMLEKMQQVPVPIEKELSWWEQVKRKAGNIAIGILALAIISGLIWYVRKIKMKN